MLANPPFGVERKPEAEARYLGDLRESAKTVEATRKSKPR